MKHAFRAGLVGSQYWRSHRRQVVGWSLKRGLRTVLNAHHDDWLDGAMTNSSFTTQLERFVSIWTQIAQRFASSPEELLAFEVYNEPHLNMTVAWLNEMNGAVLPAIRASNPTRNVLFGGLHWMNPRWIVASPDAMVFPSKDSHLFLEVHSYDPYSFCGMTAGSITHEWRLSNIDDWVESLAVWAADRGKVVLLGEFGCNKTQTNTSGRLSWYQHVREAVESKGFAATVWDDSGAFGIYDRATRQWDGDVLHALGLELDDARQSVDDRATAEPAAAARQAPLAASDDEPLRVLVFGDSQGSQGPTWRTLQDELDAHGISAHVVNKAVGGTSACGWAEHPEAMVTASREAFPNATEGPDLVWFTAGGNDLSGDLRYHECTLVASSDAEVRACLHDANDLLIACTQKLFDSLWRTFPKAKVGQYNYMATCMQGECLLEGAAYLGGPFCLEAKHSHGSASECMLLLLQYWQTIFVDELQRQYAKPRYTGMNLLGAVQQASGVPGASVGHMNVSGGGANCEWLHGCVHAIYGTPAAKAIGAAMWSLWLEPLLRSRHP